MPNPLEDPIVELIEREYPESCKAFKEIQREDYILFCNKQHDYGPGNISLGTTLQRPEDVRASWSGIIFRINDKVQRLMNLVVKKAQLDSAANEPTIDSFKDISNFGVIARIVKRGKWGK